ncbi:AAA family ATPase [Anaerobacillus sp. 1_MG-2023]|uniref:AAA family ATPase n=1 Tax=Anaerobacillus sp. 1_MG-2023 TaxID=3062655 RepID=UPI0026E2F0A5|nr:AAA family ATPase [Anaerobacillus sp. 1_MG-2023]MDO6654512.1 AAA family ATPase [Anaerobacillus sp. 1_MG-2023]
MKLKKISVTKLFGIFDHEIRLNNERGITIIIGENGLGKTKILEMLESFFKGDIYRLKNIEFECLRFEFDDDFYWEVYKEHKDEEEIALLVKENNNVDGIFALDIEEFSPERARREALHLARMHGSLRRLGADRWENRSNREIYNSIEVIEKFGAEYSTVNVIKESDPPSWFISRLESLNVSLIETQRVYDFAYPDRTHIETVKKYSGELTDFIKQKLTESTELSSKLDRTYPNRLIEQLKTGSQNISENELNEKLKELEDKRSLFDEVGLVETEKNSALSLIDNPENVVKDVLMLYVKDSFEKLEIFDELAKKIKLFLKIINARFKHKKLHVNKDDGFQFKSTVIKDKDGIFETIPLDQLSSGEKNELILFYKLIFNTSTNSLILIDEPEISLHISWQNKFISDLKEIHKLNQLDILIATHSPDIISNNWDLRVELKGVE